MNVDVNHTGYKYSRKGTGTVYSSSCTVTPPIPYIYLGVGWSMENAKSRYLIHKVTDDQFCVHDDTVINPVTSAFSVFFFSLRHKNWGEIRSNTTSDMVLLMGVFLKCYVYFYFLLLFIYITSTCVKIYMFQK